MPRPKLSAAEYIERHATEVGVILAELAENAGKAGRAWMLAVEWARRGDLDRAMTAVVEADIALDIPVRLERQDSRRILQRALALLDEELPDDDDRPVPRRGRKGSVVRMRSVPAVRLTSTKRG